MSGEQYFDSMQQHYDPILLDPAEDSNIFALPIETPPPPIFCNGSPQNSQNGFDLHRQHGDSGGTFYQSIHPFFDVSQHNNFHSKEFVQQSNFVRVVVVEQPVERCRFRYKAEQGPHGALKGVSAKGQKSVPKVQIDCNFCGTGYILASLWTNENLPRPHVNELWGSDCENGFCKINIDPTSMTVGFPNLGIMRQKEKDIVDILSKNYLRDYEATGVCVTDQMREALRERAQKETATMKDCLHCVRLGFQAFFTDLLGNQVASAIIFSSPIYNSQNPGFSALQIAEVDRSCGCCSGGDIIWMRCATKIRRDQIKIKFCEPSTNWECDACFSHNDVYEQILIIFKTPPYRNINISEKTMVNIRLFRITDGEYSPAISFVYLPKDDGPAAKRSRKIVETPYFDQISDWSNLANQHDQFLPEQSSSDHSSNPTDSPSAGQSYFTACNFLVNFSSPNISQHHQATRKRQLDDVDSATTSLKLKSLDSGIGFLKSIDAIEGQTEAPQSAASLTSEIESLTLAEYASSKKSLEIIKQHLQVHSQCQIEALRAFSTEGDTLSLIQANKHLIGAQDDLGNNALHICSKSRQPFALKTMLKVLDKSPRRANVINMQNHKGQTPLHLAVKHGDPDCVHYLLKSGSSLELQDFSGNGVAHYLAETFNESIYRDVLFPPNRQNNGQRSVDLDFLNNEGVCPVHLSVKRSKLALLEALIDAKADLNLVERNTGKMAVHMAVETGDSDILKLLLQNNAIVDQEMYDGTTALQLSIVLKRNADILRLLLNSGADPNKKTSSRKPSIGEDTTHEEWISGETSESDKFSAMDWAELEDGSFLAILKNPKIGTISDFMIQKNPSTSVGPKSPTFDHRLFSDNAFNDELCMLDFLTRLRLGKLLDKDSRWESLAAILNCDPQMIDCVRICSQTEFSSPTSFLLDQLEQIHEFTINRLVQAFQRMKLTEAVDLMNQKLWRK